MHDGSRSGGGGVVSVNESRTGIQLLDSPTSSPTPKYSATPTSTGAAAAARSSLPARSKSLFGSDDSSSDDSADGGRRNVRSDGGKKDASSRKQKTHDDVSGGKNSAKLLLQQSAEVVDVSETPLAAAVWTEEVQSELLQQKHVLTHQHHKQQQHRPDDTVSANQFTDDRSGDGDAEREEVHAFRDRSGGTFVAQPSVVVLAKRDEGNDSDDDPRQRASSDCVIVDQNSAEHWGMARRFGFPQNALDPIVCEAEQAALSMLLASATLCEQQWLNALRGVPLLANAMPETNEPLRRLARKYGIPPHIRGIMWLTLSGAALKMDENEGFCAKTLARNGYVENDDGALIIEKDLERTFPHHPYFSPRGVGIIKLKHVLHALCWRNPLIGYCQSYNFIVAVLLLVFDDEESAFWMMVYIVEHLLPNDFYGEGLLGTKVDQEVVLALLKELLPKLYSHFEAVRFDVRALVPAWTMSLFINTFPIETVIRIWDLLLSHSTAPHGLPTTVPIAVLIAFLKCHMDDLMKIHDCGDVLVYLGRAASVMYDSAKLVKLATEVKLTSVTLHQMRRKCRAAVVGENIRRQNEKIRRQRQREADASQAFVQSCNAATRDDMMSVTTPETPTFVDPQAHMVGASAGGGGTFGQRKESKEAADSDVAGVEMEMADLR